MSLPQTERDIRVARHEAAHAVALYLVLGPDAIDDKGITRVPKGGRLGKCHFAYREDLFGWKHPALLAADYAVALLAAVQVESGDGTRDFNTTADVGVVFDQLAAIAYNQARPVGVDVEDWRYDWVDEISRRAFYLLDSTVFKKALSALEAAMDFSPSLSGANVRATIRKAIG